MRFFLHKKKQKDNAVRKHNTPIRSSENKDLSERFSRKQIVSAWRELPDKERIIFFLVYIKRFGIEKTAEMMNKPITTITKETKQARVLLKKKLLSNHQKMVSP